MLKKYQKETLEQLTTFLQQCAISKDVRNTYADKTAEIFGEPGMYNDAGLENIPYVCLRLPTGGGKTFLAAHSVGIAAKEFLARDFTLVIWLVPTNPILEQTYNCLTDTNHPYRRALNEYFNDSVEILKVEEARSLQRGTLLSNTVVIISTFASWRVDKTEGRKVYDNNGYLSTHFDNLKPRQIENLEKINGSSKPVHSLANTVYLNNPVFIIDEAHNARTPLTFEVLKRLNPACVVEFTATPKTKGADRSNVLYNVTAAELKAEDMIKMPIELLTTPDWQTVIADSVKQQELLEKAAKEEERQTGEYIRPIVLIQAQNDSQQTSTINVDEVKKVLQEKLNIPDEQIAVATGTERGIEGIDLLDSTCPIRFIITKQALKEGWDCPFAYIFCSVAKVSSSKDVEQLLGRVLRMPHVIKKQKEELNRAYAFVSSQDFVETARNLTDTLVQSGFTPQEVSNLIEVSPAQINMGKYFGNVEIKLNELPELPLFQSGFEDKFEINDKESSITIKDSFTEQDKVNLISVLKNKDDIEKVNKAYDDIIYSRKFKTASKKQSSEISLPQLLIDFEGELRVFDEEVLLPTSWNLAECSPVLDEKEFPLKIESSTKGLIDIDNRGKTFTYNASAIQEELSSLIISSTMDRDSLIQWLVKECRNQSIPYSQVIVFVSNVVNNLIEKRSLHIEHLVFVRFRLKDVIKRKIQLYFTEAKKAGYQQLLFATPSIVKETLSPFSLGQYFTFPEIYPVSEIYEGQFVFTKHKHNLVGKMNNEEEQCAFRIDSNPNVECWIRNPERQEFYAFWLQTSTDKFYPDFIVKLKDGSIVVIEYKGADRYSNDDSNEKRMIGDFYASLSKGKCSFVMLNGKDWNTLDRILEIGEVHY